MAGSIGEEQVAHLPHHPLESRRAALGKPQRRRVEAGDGAAGMGRQKMQPRADEHRLVDGVGDE